MSYEITTTEKLDILAEEIKAILVESVFSANMTLLEAKHLVGRTIKENPLYQKSGKGSGEIIKAIADKIGRSERDIYLCVQFYEKFPMIETAVQTSFGEQKKITWSGVKKLIEGKTETCQHDWQKVEAWQCSHCQQFRKNKPVN
jgi:hypothetical protein